MSWESMITQHSGLIEFLNKYLKNEIENFVCVTVAETRCDPIFGNDQVLIEICMDKDYKSDEFMSFKVMDKLQKYLSLYSIHGTPTIKVIKLS